MANFTKLNMTVFSVFNLTLASLLSGCFPGNGLGTGSNVVPPSSGTKAISLSSFEVTGKTYAGFDVRFDYSGDSNNNSDITFYFCSIRQNPGCDPLSGNQIKMSKVGGKVSASITLSSYSLTAADVIKYKVQPSDSDGITGGEEHGSIVVPIDTSKVRKLSQFGFTRFGRTAGGGDYITATASDGSGNLYLGGYTNSSLGEPNAGLGDVFVAKLTSTGALDTSFSKDGLVQLGNVTIGAGASGEDNLRAMSLDGSGNIYLSGETAGSLGEVTAGGTDVFVVKLTSSGSLDTSFSTDGIVQFGSVTIGVAAAAYDSVSAMKVDASGNVYLAGDTGGALGEARAGGDDAYVIKLDSSGSLDTSFSSDGIVQLGSVTVGAGASNYDSLNAMNIDASGNIYLAGTTYGSLGETNAGSGDAYVVKLNSSGSLDTSFSTDGIVQLGNVTVGSGASGNDNVGGIGLSASGEIYIAGTTYGSLGETNAGSGDAYVVKLNPSGSLDTSFSTDGIVHLGNATIGAGASGSDEVWAINLDASGNLYLAGHTGGVFGEASGEGGDAYVVKLTSSGLLDTSFSADGIVQLGIVTVGTGSSGDDSMYTMNLDTSGNIYLAGTTTGSLGEPSAGGDDAYVIKLTSSGLLDTSFSADGIVQLGSLTIGSDNLGNDTVNAMVLDSSGSIFLAGTTTGSFGEMNRGGDDVYVVKLSPSGSLDTGFSTDGIVQLGSATIGVGANGVDTVRAISLDASGNIYLAGDTTGSLGETNVGSRDAYVAKLTSAGALDTSFSTDGIVQLGTTTVGAGASGNEVLYAMSLDTAGNIYLAGDTRGSLGESNGGGSDVFLVKLTTTGALDTSFSTDGIIQLGSSTIGAGASSNDNAYAIVLDSSGNIFLGGRTYGSLGEAGGGLADAYVVKFTSAGALDTSFSTDGILQFGSVTIGAGSSGHDSVSSMILNASGNLYLAGSTNGYLGEVGAGSGDIYVVKLTSSGTLDTSFSTDGIVHLGNVTIGSGASGNDFVGSINLDASENIYLAGSTFGSMGEANAGSGDILVVKLSSTGVLDTSFSTDGILQLGNVTIGAGASGSDNLSDMSLDASGNIYISGSTFGSLGGVNSGENDGFFGILSPTGSFD
ncbi:MAG: beta strand repeat-containing protein [Bdellovibrionales bacterium]